MQKKIAIDDKLKRDLSTLYRFCNWPGYKIFKQHLQTMKINFMWAEDIASFKQWLTAPCPFPESKYTGKTPEQIIRSYSTPPYAEKRLEILNEFKET